MVGHKGVDVVPSTRRLLAVRSEATPKLRQLLLDVALKWTGEACGSKQNGQFECRKLVGRGQGLRHTFISGVTEAIERSGQDGFGVLVVFSTRSTP